MVNPEATEHGGKSPDAETMRLFLSQTIIHNIGKIACVAMIAYASYLSVDRICKAAESMAINSPWWVLCVAMLAPPGSVGVMIALGMKSLSKQANALRNFIESHAEPPKNTPQDGIL